jgi:RimJ/RimL family protein N-acetyltransferase
MIEFGRADHGKRIAKAAGFIYGASDIVISRTERGELLGGVVLYDFTGRAVSMHVAGLAPNWIVKDLLWVVFHYPFVQLGCASIFCQIKSSNEKAIRFVDRIGFEPEVIIKDVFPGNVDLVVRRMYANTCRWLKILPSGITSGGCNYG